MYLMAGKIPVCMSIPQIKEVVMSVDTRICAVMSRMCANDHFHENLGKFDLFRWLNIAIKPDQKASSPSRCLLILSVCTLFHSKTIRHPQFDEGVHSAHLLGE